MSSQDDLGAIRRMLTLALIVAALYFASAVFIPLALASVLAVGLNPIVEWLRERGLRRGLGIAVTVIVALGALGASATLIGYQAVQLAENLPTYQSNIRKKIASVTGDGGTLDKLSAFGTSLEGALAGGDQGPKPLPVAVKETKGQTLKLLQSAAGPFINPFATAGLVVILLIFMLAKKTDIRDRLIKFTNHGDMRRSMQALSEAAERIGRYLLMLSVVNITYGLPVGIGLYFIGVPNAALWGVLATILRFIPYLGPIISAVFPLSLAFAVDPGWNMLIWVAALIIVIELISNNIVEPLVYGNSTGLSEFAIILAAMIFTVLWGTAGLVLATPLTACLVVLGEHIPALRVFVDLFGNQSPLTPRERLYQRLLAGNVEEALDIAAESPSTDQFLEEVAVPMISLAVRDQECNQLQPEASRAIASTLWELLEALSPEQEEAPASTIDVLCQGGRTDLDQAAAAILAAALEHRGIRAGHVKPGTSLAGRSENASSPSLVCIVFSGRESQGYARVLRRRVRAHFPHVKMLTCVLSESVEVRASPTMDAKRDRIAFGFQDCVTHAAAWSSELGTGSPTAMDSEPRVAAMLTPKSA